MKRLAFCLITMLLAPAAALAVPDVDMVRCSSIVGDAERLACYDELAGSLGAEAAAAAAARKAAAAEAAKQAAIAAEERRKQAFGGGAAASDSGEADLDELTGKVVEAATDAYGNYLLLLDNGQLWKQLDGNLLTVRSGDAVTIERAALGSYRLKVERQRRAVRAKRVR